MSVTTAIILAAVLILVVFLGAAYFLMIQIEKRMGPPAEPSGELLIDPGESTPGEGVYVIFHEDPKAFTDGKPVLMSVKIVRK